MRSLPKVSTSKLRILDFNFLAKKTLPKFKTEHLLILSCHENISIFDFPALRVLKFEIWRPKINKTEKAFSQ